MRGSTNSNKQGIHVSLARRIFLSDLDATSEAASENVVTIGCDGNADTRIIVGATNGGCMEGGSIGCKTSKQDVCAASMRQLITVDCKGAANGACENDVTEGIYREPMPPVFATCYLKATKPKCFSLR